MADPLSIVLGVLSLIEAANKARKGIEKILSVREAPERLQDLYNEVSELSTLASILKNVAHHPSLQEGVAVERLQHLLTRAKKLMTQMMNFITSKLVKDPRSLIDSTKKIEIRWANWFLEEKNINTMTARLSQVKQSLQAALTALSAVELPHMRVAIQNIDSRISSMQSSFMQALETRLSASPVSHARHDNATPPTSVEPQHERQLQVYSSSWESSVASELPVKNMLTSSAGNRLVVESVIIQAPRSSSLCSCSCHSPLAVNTPQWLGSAIGTLLIQYTRDPRACRHCAHKACQSGTRSILKTKYYFPRWMLRQAMFLQFNYTPWTGHNMSLKTPRVISATSPIFSFAQHDNIEGMRRLFKDGLASPFDISYEEGRSALHFAVTAEKPKMVKFLLEQHADPESEDNNTLTAYHVAWNYYLQNPGNVFYEDFLATIGISHHDTDTLATRKFSVVHRIVLGLSNIDLDEYLAAASEEIDRQDQMGKTPLCWAASRPNPKFVEVLLRHGASLHIGDSRKQTPLHYCAGSGDARSMELLLKYARQHENIGGQAEQSPQHSSGRAIRELVNVRDSKGRTPLNFATRMDFPVHAQLLIAAGADMETSDEPLGRTIVLTAIYWNSRQVLSILLANGTRTDQYDARNASILHYAARYANLETLNVLLQNDLGSLDVEARDDGGLTPLQTFDSNQERVECESEHHQSASAAVFASILARQRNRTARCGQVVSVVEHAYEVVPDASDENSDGVSDGTSDVSSDFDASSSIDDFYDAVPTLTVE